MCLCKDSTVSGVSSKAVFMCRSTNAKEGCRGSVSLCIYLQVSCWECHFLSSKESFYLLFIYTLSKYLCFYFILAVLCEWLNSWRMYVFLMQVFVNTVYCNMSCWWMYHYISLTYLCSSFELPWIYDNHCSCAVYYIKHWCLTRSILTIWKTEYSWRVVPKVWLSTPCCDWLYKEIEPVVNHL